MIAFSSSNNASDVFNFALGYCFSRKRVMRLKNLVQTNSVNKYLHDRFKSNNTFIYIF